MATNKYTITAILQTDKEEVEFVYTEQHTKVCNMHEVLELLQDGAVITQLSPIQKVEQ